MPAWFPLPPHPFTLPFSFIPPRRADVARGLKVRVGSDLEPRCAKNLTSPCGNGRCGRRVCMYNTTHYSTYKASPRQPAYILGDADSSIRMPAWLRLPQSFSFPTKLLLGVKRQVPSPSLCQEERRSPPAHGQIVSYMPAWLPLSRSKD